MFDRRRLVQILCACGAASVVGAASVTRADSSPKVMLFNIPAQPLPSALLAYSAVTGDQVVCDTRLAAGQRSVPVVGLFTAQTALRMLVDGTDLIIRYTGPQDITLVSARAGPGSDASSATALGDEATEVLALDTLHVEVALEAARTPDFGDYARTVRLAVKQALARDPDTADRVYDLQIDIWINREGRVRQPRLLRSSGRPGLDAAVRRVLSTTVIKAPPPAGLSQPIRIAVSAI